ncbi:unnamed protein product, partial [marine sediment metagenome]
ENFSNLIKKKKEYKRLIAIAQRLEGLNRHASIHASGVVITPGTLTDYVPLYMSRDEGKIATQYDMKSVEQVGLLKIDILGLRTLTVIENTMKLLEEENKRIDIEKIPLDDLCNTFLSIFSKKIFNYFTPSIITEVYINIWHCDTFKVEKSFKYKTALEDENFSNLIKKKKEYKRLIAIAQRLEGLNRHASIHASGVVITPGTLTDYVPLYMSRDEGKIATQYDMKSVEQVGLLKIDILGLRTLTVIENTMKLLEEENKRIDIEKIPLDDPKTYSIL